MLFESIIDKLSMMDPFFFFLFPILFLRRVFNLFINIAVTPALPHPSPRLLLSLHEETERILIELVNGKCALPENGMLYEKLHSTKNTQNNLTTVPPPFHLREPHGFIHTFWFLNPFVLRPQIPRWKTFLLKPFTILKT